MERISVLLAIAFAGSIGAISRYLLSALIQGRFFTSFPIGTLMINILGCLMIGIFIKMGPNVSDSYEIWRTVIIVGFIGSFTTFSTFASEIYEFFRNGHPVWGIVYFLCSSILGVAMVYLAATYMHFSPNKK